KQAYFDRCFAELAKAGLALADWSARVVWLPGAVAGNEPSSYKVARGWQRYLAEIPDCDLKAEAGRALAQADGPPRVPDASRRVFGSPPAAADPSRKGTESPTGYPIQNPIGSPNQNGIGNPTRYQEQEKDKEPPPPLGGGGGAAGFDEFWKTYPQKKR